VNVKWYLKREGLLDMTEAVELDYYLVLTGPKASARDVRTVRAWRIDAAYLFDAQQLLAAHRPAGSRSESHPVCAKRDGWQPRSTQP
jgi:hypothetical protein